MGGSGLRFSMNLTRREAFPIRRRDFLPARILTHFHVKRILLPLLAGIALGAAVVLLWHQSADARTRAALKQDGDAKVAQLQRELASARSEVTAWQQRLEATGAEDAPARENVLDIQRILNDARPLMKTLALMFGERRKEMTDRMIRGMASKLAEQMGLTEAQTEAMIAHFTALDAANFEKVKAMLDRKLTILDVFNVMNESNPQKTMDAYVQQAMTPEQKAAWENRKLETKAEQLERTTNWKLDRMSGALKLDEAQKDQVFSILVKTNPDYDPSLGIEGLTGTTPDTTIPLKEEDAIASVLRPEQMQDWSAYQKKQAAEKSRLTDAFGGLDPTSFFRSMGGGMGGFGRTGR